MTSRLLLAATCLALSVCDANADTVEQDVVSCAKISNSDLRLECFDRIAVDHQLSKEPKPLPHSSSDASPRGFWRVRTERSKFDDTTNVYLSIDADKKVLIGKYDLVLPKLYLRCMEKETSMYIVVDHFLGTDEIQLEYRIDDERTKSPTWGISTDHKAVGLWVRSSAIPFIESLFNKERLLFRMTPYSESPITFQFDIRGLKSSIDPLVTACKWHSPTETMVWEVQMMLKALGYDPGPLDGHFGGKTREAIEAFERDQEMPNTGKVSDDVYRAVEAAWFGLSNK